MSAEDIRAKLVALRTYRGNPRGAIMLLSDAYEVLADHVLAEKPPALSPEASQALAMITPIGGGHPWSCTCDLCKANGHGCNALSDVKHEYEQIARDATGAFTSALDRPLEWKTVYGGWVALCGPYSCEIKMESDCHRLYVRVAGRDFHDEQLLTRHLAEGDDRARAFIREQLQKAGLIR